MTGLAGKQGAMAAAAGGVGGTPALTALLSQASEVSGMLCGKMSEYVGSQASTILPMVGCGALIASLVFGTLFALSRYMDKDPFLYNNGKMGKLEAQSAYANKKRC